MNPFIVLVILPVISSLCIVLGGIYGFSLSCNCPQTFENSTVSKIDGYKSFSCVAIINSTIVDTGKICKRYDNYEVAIVFFSIGILIFFIVILVVLYNIYKKRFQFQYNKNPPLSYNATMHNATMSTI
jgi:uncharacterized protein YneF (UPF0154 family)